MQIDSGILEDNAKGCFGIGNFILSLLPLVLFSFYSLLPSYVSFVDKVAIVHLVSMNSKSQSHDLYKSWLEHL